MALEAGLEDASGPLVNRVLAASPSHRLLRTMNTARKGDLWLARLSLRVGRIACLSDDVGRVLLHYVVISEESVGRI